MDIFQARHGYWRDTNSTKELGWTLAYDVQYEHAVLYIDFEWKTLINYNADGEHKQCQFCNELSELPKTSIPAGSLDGQIKAFRREVSENSGKLSSFYKHSLMF